MVAGFGTGYEPHDRKLIPDRLTAFRKFRFKPRPAFESTTSLRQEWTGFSMGVRPWDLMKPNMWQNLGYALELKGAAYVETYYGANEWKPCLTAAGYGNVVYGPGEYEAICASSFFKERHEWDGHEAPLENCSCGFWAYYKPDQIDTGNGNDWMATAAVEVWGTVILGEKGVRAQKMRIVGLLTPRELVDSSIPIVQAWNKVVGELSVPQYWNRAEFLEFHPPQDVSELLPKHKKPPQYPYVDDGSFVSTINRRQLWQHMSAMTTNVASSSAPATPYAYVPAYTIVPYSMVVDACCVCKYKVHGRTQEDADKMMAAHMIEKHMDLEGTSCTNP